MGPKYTLLSLGHMIYLSSYAIETDEPFYQDEMNIDQKSCLDLATLSTKLEDCTVNVDCQNIFTFPLFGAMHSLRSTKKQKNGRWSRKAIENTKNASEPNC